MQRVKPLFTRAAGLWPPEEHHCGLTRAVSLQKGSGYKQAARKTNSARDTLLYTARGSATAAVQQAARGMKK